MRVTAIVAIVVGAVLVASAVTDMTPINLVRAVMAGQKIGKAVGESAGKGIEEGASVVGTPVVSV